MPAKGSTRSFKNYQNCVRNLLVIYVDFETHHKQLDEQRGNTKVDSMHVPFAFSIVCVSTLSNFQPAPIVYCAEDAPKVFVDKLQGILDRFHAKFAKSKKMAFQEEDRKKFQAATHCYSCKTKFDHKTFKVKDHCHFSSVYRGALCNRCNLPLPRTWRIPVFAHNMKNFHSSLFIRHLSGRGPNHDVSAILANSQKNILFTLQKGVAIGKRLNDKGEEVDISRFLELVFLDSCRHLLGRLETLVSNLREEHLVCLKRKFGNGKKFELMRRKGIFPYEHFDSFERVYETKLPPSVRLIRVWT